MKIGIFDSGLGGLTIFKSIRQRLPAYDYVYLGDTARTPYGSRSFEAIYKFTTESVQFLFGQDCFLVIIACNTASAKALRNIQQKILPVTYPSRRVLGVIRPSVEELGRYTRTRTVALWATEGTVKSMSFEIELKKLAPEIRLIQQACPILVPLVEAGELNGDGAKYFVEKYWRESQAQSSQIDTLLLACTHYPLLLPVIKASLPAHIRILVQGDFVAPSLESYLQRHSEIEEKLTRNGTARFLTTDQGEGFDRLAQVFLGYPVKSERVEF